MKLKKIIESGSHLAVSNGTLLFLQWKGSRKHKFYSYSKKQGLISISERDYSGAIGGQYWEKIERELRHPIHDYSWTTGLNDSRYFLSFREGIIHGFDKSGIKDYEFDVDSFIGSGHAIYDIKFQAPSFMWLAFPSGQTVTQIDLIDRKEVFRIGDYTFEEVYEPLSYPESLFINGKDLYIPNMGTGKLFKLNLETKELKDYLDIEGKLWEYIKINDTEFIKLDEGIYELEK